LWDDFRLFFYLIWLEGANMGRTCFVPNCKSGYCSEKFKVSVFRVPKEKVNEWKKIIPRKDKNLTENDFICQKHFQIEFIIREVKTETYSVSAFKK
jgi:hypothetical protein